MTKEMKELNVNEVVACIKEATGKDVVIEEVKVNGDREVIGESGELTLFMRVIKK